MKSLLASLLLGAVVTFAGYGASAADRPFSDEQIAAEGINCVGGYHSTRGATEFAVKFFAGNSSAFHEHVTRLGTTPTPSDAPFVPKYVTKVVVLHPGKKTISRIDQPKRDIAADWSVTTWPADSVGPMKFHLQIDVWFGGQIQLEQLDVPSAFVVVSGGEFEKFIDRHQDKMQQGK